MLKRKIEGNDIRTYLIWEMPEIELEIPSLLEKAGKARIVGKNLFYVYVDVQLTNLARVVNWRLHWGDGVAINSCTLACFSDRLSISVLRLPKAGDEVVRLVVALKMNTFREADTVTLDDFRGQLRAFADRMTKTWYYHFR